MLCQVLWVQPFTVLSIICVASAYVQFNFVTWYCDAVPGWNMTTVLLQVSQGRRPCLEIIPEQRPSACEQIICMMKQCWDQEPKKRPHFSGANKKGLGKRRACKGQAGGLIHKPYLANVFRKLIDRRQIEGHCTPNWLFSQYRLLMLLRIEKLSHKRPG